MSNEITFNEFLKNQPFAKSNSREISFGLPRNLIPAKFKNVPRHPQNLIPAKFSSHKN